MLANNGEITAPCHGSSIPFDERDTIRRHADPVGESSLVVTEIAFDRHHLPTLRIIRVLRNQVDGASHCRECNTACDAVVGMQSGAFVEAADGDDRHVSAAPIPSRSTFAVTLSLSSLQRCAAVLVINTLRPTLIRSGPIPIDQSLCKVGTLIRCCWQNSSMVSAPSRTIGSAE
jgi:hypothetical protein